MSNPHHSPFPTISFPTYIPRSFVQPPVTPLRSFIPSKSSRLHRVETLLPRNLLSGHRIQPTMAVPIKPLVRAVVCPAIFSAILIQHTVNPTRLPDSLPQLWPVNTSVLQPKQGVPVSTLSSLRLGRLIERMENPSVIISEEQILAEARGLLTRDAESLDDLRKLETYLENLESRAPLTRRLQSALTFADLLWLVSIAGLGVTLWPTLKLLLGTVLASATELLMQIVFPVLIQLHRIGVFEVMAYAASTMIIAQAARYLPAFGVGEPGSYVALTGFVGSLLSFWYSLRLHLGEYIDVKNPYLATLRGGEDPNGFLRALFQVSVIVPLGVVHQSELLGFIGALAMRNLLDSIVNKFPLGAIGFDETKKTDYMTISSSILVGIFVGVRLLGDARFAWMESFHLGVMVVGNMGYFIGLLIRASRYKARGSEYVIAQMQMLASLAAAIGLGNFYGIVSLNSTGTVFGSLYVVEKLNELELGQWIIAVWFGTFGLLYAAAGYIRTHPELLKGLIDASGLL